MAVATYDLFQPGPIVWVQQFFGPGHATWFLVVSELGATWGVVLAVGLALWLWGRRDAYALVGIIAVEAGLSVLLNQIFHVPRPSDPAVIRYEQLQLGSFPSGHVLLATLLWGLLYTRGRVAGWVFALAAGGVAVSRLYLGVHYLADVIGGMLIGMLVVGLYQPLWSRLADRLEAWGFGVFVGLGLLVIAGVAAGFALGFFGSNPFKWHAAGVALGGAPALLLEHRYVHYTATPAGLRSAAARVGIGLVGLVPLAVVDRLTGEGRPWSGLVLIALGTLWAVWIVPALLQRLEARRASRGGARQPPMRRSA